MKAALFVAAVVAGLMAVFIFDSHQAAVRNGGAATLFGCRAPAVEGEITIITIDVRAGQLVGVCQYAATRPSKPKKGG